MGGLGVPLTALRAVPSRLRWLSRRCQSVASFHDTYAGADRSMLSAIRRIGEADHRIVLQVLPAFAPDTADVHPSIAGWARAADVRIRCYSHAHLLSDAAIQHVLHAADDADTAIFFLDLRAATLRHAPCEAEGGLAPLRRAIYGAARSVRTRNVLVCGLPNVGKSSLVRELTKSSVTSVKLKGEYHLARVSARPGATLHVKSHRLDATTKPVMLIDTPGLLPTRVSEAQILLLAASGILTVGSVGGAWPWRALVAQGLDGLNRHARLSLPASMLPAYVSALGMAAPTDDEAQVLALIAESVPLKAAASNFLRSCRAGELGGWLLSGSGGRETAHLSQEAALRSPRPLLEVQRDRPILTMNARAHELASACSATQIPPARR